MPSTARLILPAALLALVFVLPGQVAHAQKAKPACGILYLPLVEGNEWVYEPLATPTPKDEGEEKRLQLLTRLAPKPPTKIEIKVVSVKPVNKVTEITLQEIAHEPNDEKVEKTTTLRCTAGSLEVDPQSFFFAGEPGGGLQMTLENIVWDGGYPGRAGFRRGTEFIIKFTADVIREATIGSNATLPRAKVEIERQITVGLKEKVSVASGEYKQAVAVWFQLSGRGMVEPDIKKNVEIPIGENGILWFQDRVGMVQVKNRSGQWFQLVDQKLN